MTIPDDVMKTASEMAKSIVNAMCTTYRHDYGLMPEPERNALHLIFSQIAAHEVRPAIAQAILADRERDRWMPIETAPRDGTVILAGRFAPEPKERDGLVAVGWCRGPRKGGGYTGFGSLNSYHWPPTHWPPTHWQPLPAPPKDTIGITDSTAAIVARIRAQDAEIERLREAITPSADTKYAYSGEFYCSITTIKEDEDGNEIEVTERHMISWTTIKEIMAAITARAALKGGDA